VTDGWRIDPGPARGAIDKAEGETQEFPTLETDLVSALSDALAALGGHGPSTAAKLQSIQSNPFEIDLLAAQKHIEQAISATRQAIGAYEAGDEQMAATYENGIPQ
jgi:hypothetical protein